MLYKRPKRQGFLLGLASNKPFQDFRGIISKNMQEGL